MKTLYAWYRGEKDGLSACHHPSRAEAEAYKGLNAPKSDGWELREFVSLDDVCDWLGRADKGHWMVKDLREAVSGGS